MCVCVFLFPLEGGSEEEYATDRDYLIGNHDFVGYHFLQTHLFFGILPVKIKCGGAVGVRNKRGLVQRVVSVLYLSAN